MVSNKQFAAKTHQKQLQYPPPLEVDPEAHPGGPGPGKLFFHKIGRSDPGEKVELLDFFGKLAGF